MLIPFDELFYRHKLNFHGVLHIGANVGEERFMYDKVGIKKQIWIEGNHDVYLRLKQNIAYNKDAIALNYLIGDENRDAVLHVSNNGSQSSSVLEFGTHAQEHPDVHFVRDIPLKMHRIDSLGLDLSGIDFLNIDLQGAELMALLGMGELLSQFRACYLEVNKSYVYKGCPLVEDLDAYLSKFGFARVETRYCGNHTWGDALWIKT